jgi:transcription termination factor Rho
MRRSTLQRKDRDELTKIAETLGKKPPSRARKGEIIDLILDLAAGGDGSSVSAPEKAEASPEPEPSPTPVKDEAVTPAADSSGTTDSDTSDSAETSEESEDSSSSSGSDGDRQQNRNRGERNGRNDRNDRNDQDQGQDRGESGNRRRRRRGRDRDNPREGGSDNWDGEPVPVEGYLDLRSDGYGFIRVNGMLASRDDAYVPVKLVRQFSLRKGDKVSGPSRPANRNEKNPALLSVDQVNGGDPQEAASRPQFDDLTPLFPDERLLMEMKGDRSNMTARIIDLLAPIGKGQRGLIVSPPKAGKTSILKQIIRSIEANNPEVHLMVLLVDERPEEVTDMKRWLRDGEVISSTFDKPTEEHITISEMAIERAKRMVEGGRDVCVILDGITRLARAYNLEAPQSGRVMSGGVDAAALYPPKKFFGAARNVEEGGSLTILATALVDTGSRMDEVIFEEFKGTGNMELRLDRSAAERRIYPAIDVDGSSTRHEELLFAPKQLNNVWKLRRVLGALSADGKPSSGLEMLIERLGEFKSNDEFLAEVGSSASAS